jgi:uncharacterized protein YdhG (YjbR/CyaY superfamily)
VTQDIERYLASLDSRQRIAVETTFSRFRDALPGGEIVITYGLPTIRVGGKHLISVGGFAQHNSVFPGPDAISRMGLALKDYSLSKGTVQFDKEKALSSALVKRFVTAAIDSLNARYPKKDGTFLEYYDNGFMKQQGKYRNGHMQGAWKWWRRDGSLMRSGSFREGEKTGEWVTYDRNSTPI